MATTTIAAEIADITGETADADFIVSAQRFVVANIPKDLLLFAQSVSAASTDGTAISFKVNDSIVDVQRNGFSCNEIPLSQSKSALNSLSLKFATESHPVWYHKQGFVHFAPVTDGSNAGYVFFIDYSKIDDTSDLRNAVINYACFKEFAKLMMDSTHQGDFSNSGSTMGTEHWITTEEDSEMLMARIQVIQAQLGEKNHYGQMSQQHYNLALAEVKSYIENNPKTLQKVLAMQGAK
tara:strand:+ start:256 stop:966 length:711 start_codon:yes stop_codon:yes gene_type:complete